MNKTIVNLFLFIRLFSVSIYAQVLDVTFDDTYIANESWAAWELLYPQDSTPDPDQTNYDFLPDGFGVITPTYSNGITTPMYLASENKLTMGAPQNGNATAEDTWFTYTATGLTVGKTYEVYATINQYQGWEDVSYALAAWHETRPPDGYVVANEQITSPITDYSLTGIFIASHTEMTFGIGAGKTAKYFHKTQIIDWIIEEDASGTAGEETNIARFEFDNQIGSSMIDALAYTITVIMPFETDISALIPSIMLSAGATCIPASGVVQNFSAPVTYTVTSQDVTAHQEWVVTVYKQFESSSANLINNSEFDIPPGAPVGLTAMDTTITAGDILLYSFNEGEVRFTQDTSGKLSGPNSGYVEIIHQGWAEGYVRLETTPLELDSGNYDLFFVYNCGTDIIALTPTIIAEAGTGSTLWSDATTQSITGAGTYSKEITISANEPAAKLVIFLGVQYGLYNTGKSFYIDVLKLAPQESIPDDTETGITIIARAVSSVVSIYPNPAKDYVNIDLSGIRNPVSLSVYCLTGVKVYENNNASGTIYIHNLTSGMYLVNVDNAIFKLIIE